MKIGMDKGMRCEDTGKIGEKGRDSIYWLKCGDFTYTDSNHFSMETTFICLCHVG